MVQVQCVQLETVSTSVCEATWVDLTPLPNAAWNQSRNLIGARTAKTQTEDKVNKIEELKRYGLNSGVFPKFQVEVLQEGIICWELF
eukprot:4716388-Amphidinium_carterae.1